MCARLPGDILNYLEDKLLPRSLPVLQKSFLACINRWSRRQSNAMGRTQDRKSTELDSISGLMPCPCNCTVLSSPHYHPPPCPNKVICPQSTAFLKTFLNIQARCVMCLLVVKRGETTNQCTHTFVFATIFIRHSVRHSEKRKRKIIVVASAEWREVGVRTEQIGT